jgi:ABC-type glutathione transport system ATPase component
MRESQSPLLTVRDLHVTYSKSGGTRPLPHERTAGTAAVNGVTFTVERGETVGVIGESGSGKSTIARCVMGLVRPTSGTIEIGGRDVSSLRGRRRRELYRSVQMVFQNPEASLDPQRSVGASIAEPLRAHRAGTRSSRRARVADLLDSVGLDRSAASYRPAEFSGGERQRIGIARALAIEPDLIVYDEPVSALDVSVQAQILNLIRDLQDQLRLTYLFITHDIGVVRAVSDRVLVMRAGQIVEQGAAESVCADPGDPYTRQLIDAAQLAPAVPGTT